MEVFWELIGTFGICFPRFATSVHPSVKELQRLEKITEGDIGEALPEKDKKTKIHLRA